MSLSELGIDEHGFLTGSKDTFSVLGPQDSRFNSIEVFGDEVSMVLNSTSLFRDIAYTVVLPANDDFVERVHRCINSRVDLTTPDIYQGSPYSTIRFYIMVSHLFS